MSKAQQIVDALGGADNIEDVEGCITRLRCELKDSAAIDEAGLKAAGAHGVVVAGNVVQVVVGTTAEMLADDVNDLL